MYEAAKTALGTVGNWCGVAVSIRKRMNDWIERMPIWTGGRRSNVDPGLFHALCRDTTDGI